MTVTRRFQSAAIGIIVSLLATLLVVGAPPAFAAGFVVNVNDDLDGSCTPLHCNLRQAIEAANATPGVDTISFNLPQVSTTIRPTRDLPRITESVVVDATTQPGYAGSPVVVLQGGAGRVGLEGPATSGLSINSDGSTVRGLVINGFPYYGLRIDGNDNIIEGNYIGTDASGDKAIPNGHGIRLWGGSGNRIGGASEGAGNLVSGNTYIGMIIDAPGTVIEGNFIGTDKNGVSALPNLDDGIRVRESDVRIGGTSEGSRNVISGNEQYGVKVEGPYPGAARAQIIGNYIGTDASGTRALGNRSGVLLIGPDNVVGGADSGEGNLISGNRRAGVAIDPSVGNRVQGNLLGTDVSGEAPLGNGTGGVVVVDAAGPNMIGGTLPGEGNTIAFNRFGVIVVEGWGQAFETTVRGNSIFENAELGIELSGRIWPDGVTPNDPGDVDDGANRLQNFPVLEGGGGRSPIVHGTMSSTPNTAFVIELFSTSVCDPSGSGEGEALLETVTVTTDSTGTAKFTANLRSSDGPSHVTATATDPQGNTSEFSNCA